MPPGTEPLTWTPLAPEPDPAPVPPAAPDSFSFNLDRALAALDGSIGDPAEAVPPVPPAAGAPAASVPLPGTASTAFTPPRPAPASAPPAPAPAPALDLPAPPPPAPTNAAPLVIPAPLAAPPQAFAAPAPVAPPPAPASIPPVAPPVAPPVVPAPNLPIELAWPVSPGVDPVDPTPALPAEPVVPTHAEPESAVDHPVPDADDDEPAVARGSSGTRRLAQQADTMFADEPAVASTPPRELPELPDLSTLTLPAAAPAPPPEALAAAPTERMPNPSEIRQFRSAQKRAARQARKGRAAGRMMFALVVFAGAIGFALTIGRTYLFPTAWDAGLEQHVTRLESARGPGFGRVVPLVEQPADEYAASLQRALFTGELEPRLPLWRALGLAAGGLDDPQMTTELGVAFSAVYDPETDTIVRRMGATSDAAVARAMAVAFAAHGTQAGAGGPVAPGLLGLAPVADQVGVFVEPPADEAEPADADDDPADATADAPGETPETADAAIDGDVVVAPEAGDDAGREAIVEDEAPAAEPEIDLSRLPLPLVYQLTAPPQLAAVMPAATDVDDRLDDWLGAATPAVLDLGDSPQGQAFTLGLDDWTLVWANRLGSEAVDRLVAGTVAESAQAFQRGDVFCVAAVFGLENELFTAAALQDLGAWAAAAPAAAQAEATLLDSTTVQLVSCDPGAQAAAPNLAAVDALVRRQLARLAAG